VIGGACWGAICVVVVVCRVVEVVLDVVEVVREVVVVDVVREVVEVVVREVEVVEALAGVGVGVALLAWDADGDGDGELGAAEDAAGAYDITRGGELLWRRDRGLVHHLAGQL
jgi:hypothetical protein